MTPISTTGQYSTGPPIPPGIAAGSAHASETRSATCGPGPVAAPDADADSDADGVDGAGSRGAPADRTVTRGGRPAHTHDRPHLAGGNTSVGPACLGTAPDALRQGPPGRGPGGGPGRPGSRGGRRPGALRRPGGGKGVVSVELTGTGAPPLRTTYEPVTAAVKEGAEVAAGEVVGTVEAGNSHCATTTCVHWGLLRGDTYLDPLTLLPPWLLRRGPSRLLPVQGVPVPTTCGHACRQGRRRKARAALRQRRTARLTPAPTAARLSPAHPAEPSPQPRP